MSVDAVRRVRVCVGCDCTDDSACLDEKTGQTCYWVEGANVDICSVCARLAAELGLGEDPPADFGEPALDAEPLVQLYSDADANRAIAAARAGRV